MEVKLGLLKEFFILEVWEFRVYKLKGQKFEPRLRPVDERLDFNSIC